MEEDTAMPDAQSEIVSYPHLVLPGELLSTDSAQTLKLGPGLRHVTNTTWQTLIQATQAGLLHKTKRAEYYVDYNSRRYIPSQGESVIGQITARTADNYRVDINSAHQATLSNLAFEAAIKQNRPQLNVTQLVYARVSAANKDIEPELECFDATTGKSAGFGELKGGLLIDGLSMGWCRRLMREDKGVLTEIGTHIGFQCAVGKNGRVWVDAGDVNKTVIVARAIKETEGKSEEESRTLVRLLVLSE